MFDAIRSKIKAWYASHRRELPWRSSKNAYTVWLSEIILQQTRVEQGTPYFLKFSDRFKSVGDLASAPEDEILKLWQGLGYYSRARNLHAAAKQVHSDFDGNFPNRYDDLITLKGVGEYTASAIASIAGNEVRAVVDGNVIRVISRLFGIESPSDERQTLKQIKELANELIDKNRPGDHNQSMMDFGALQCVPRNPNCSVCPLTANCQAFALNAVDRIPAKKTKIKRRIRYFHYLIPIIDDQTLIEKRGDADIWAGLYQFPLIETDEQKPMTKVDMEAFIGTQIEDNIIVRICPKHVLTHQDIYATCYHFQIKMLPESKFKLAKISELHTFALPRLIDRYLEHYPL